MSIDSRKLVTGSLLAFVAVTAVTLGVKEVRHARAVTAADEARIAMVAAAASAGTEPPAPRSVKPGSTATAPSPDSQATAPSPAARPRVQARRSSPSPITSPPSVPQPPDKPRSTVVVAYYHATARCVSCLKIEDLTSAAVTTRLAGPLAEKRLLWRVVNVDEPENNHFVKDYRLYTKSVIVSEVKEGHEVRWKNLDQVWRLLGDSAAFQSYVEREVRAYLEPA